MTTALCVPLLSVSPLYHNNPANDEDEATSFSADVHEFIILESISIVADLVTDG